MATTKIPHGINIGLGAGEVYKLEQARNTHEFRTIKSGAGISVVNNANEIEIANSAAYHEQLLGFYWYASYAAYLIANPDIDLQGKNFTTSVKVSDLVKLHENYNGGDIYARMTGYFFSPANVNDCTINVKCRWQSVGDDLDVAFPGAGITLTIQKPNIGGYRVFVSTLVKLIPDGAFTTAKCLLLRYRRSDANVDTPIVTHVKIRYPIA